MAASTNVNKRCTLKTFDNKESYWLFIEMDIKAFFKIRNECAMAPSPFFHPNRKPQAPSSFTFLHLYYSKHWPYCPF